MFLGNLHPNITEEDLLELLKPFGEVQALALARNEEGVSKGFAFATFSKVEEAQTVMTQLGKEGGREGRKGGEEGSQVT